MKAQSTQPQVTGTPQEITQYQGDFIQWAAESNNIYRPQSKTQKVLPTGIYTTEFDMRGLYFQQVPLVTDELIEIPDTAGIAVLESMETFWQNEQKFRELGQIYKRGILLYGAPGCGKTSIVKLLTKQLLKQDGLVLLFSNPEGARIGLKILREIEPDRRLIMIMEDIEELTERWGEHTILSVLDGEMQVDNIVFLATTNYPEDLDKRITNRPARFDRVIQVEMPSEVARLAYFQAVIPAHFISPEDLHKWVADTEGLGIAHLREIIIATYCLNEDYDAVVARLKGMKRTPKTSDAPSVKGFGVNNSKG